ncbi:hypothetical protein AMJ85_00825 [candidate division BRC1 bacterium SM23_51]|nr:MAG: hypothetical protein AMJ85_00825 [candidate division BRC1 bacterium SM23_51]
MVQEEKIEIASRLAEQIRQAKVMVFADYRGMTVKEATELRARCRQSNVRFQVVKNRLAKRGFGEAGVAPPEEILRGPTAIAFGWEEPTTPARVLAEFAKDCEHLAIKGGFLGERWLDTASVEQLAKIPPREILLSRLVGSLHSPLRRLAWVLRAPTVQLATTLKAVAAQRAS